MPGFVRVTGPSELAFPDYDGNGMFKSLGNILVNPNVGLLFIDLHEQAAAAARQRHCDGQPRRPAARAYSRRPDDRASAGARDLSQLSPLHSAARIDGALDLVAARWLRSSRAEVEELSGFQGSRAPAAADASRLRRGHAKAGPNTPCLSKVIGLAKRRRVAHHRTAVIASSMAADWIKGAYLALAAPPPLDKRQCYQHCVRMNRWKKTKDGQIALANKRAEAWWKFPEALDPDQPDGSAIALPPDPPAPEGGPLFEPFVDITAEMRASNAR